MRKINLLTVFVLITIARTWSQPYTVAVNKGFGSGIYNTGDSVYILADPPAAGFIFDGWTTNAELTDSFTPATMLRNLSADAALTPILTSTPIWTESADSINGSLVLHYFPGTADKLRGVILFFHDQNGSVYDWFKGIEGRAFLNYAVAKGYGVLATQSTDRLTGAPGPWQWNNNFTVASNPDMKNVEHILDTFTNRKLIDYDTHLYAVGYSQSGGFASIISAVKKFKACCLINSPGYATAMNTTNAPTYFIVSRNDTLVDRIKLMRCDSNYHRLLNRSLPAILKIHEPFPVTPNRFLRIPGVDSTTAVNIFVFLQAQGFFDTTGFLKFNPAADTSWMSLIPVGDTVISKEIANQVFICYSENRFYHDDAYHVMQFFGMFAKWPTGIEQAAITNAVKLYPNPAGNYINIEGLPDHASLKITDLQGKEVLPMQRLHAGVDISSLQNGFYVAIIQVDGASSIARKFIKQ